MNQLPTITSSQAWCCTNGCGECRPCQAQHEYFRSEDFDGNLIESKTETIYVSHCCRADLLLWDEGKQDFVEWSYVAANPNNCAGCDHKTNPQDGWCYMFRDEPQEVCAQHTARYSQLVECPRGCGLMAPCPDCGPTLHG